MAVDHKSETPANRFNDLPEETQEFLAQLRGEDITTLKDGLRLVISMQTVGTFMKWLIVGMLGFVVGVVMLGEAIGKILSWLRG
ncbi:hypothetical protein ACLBWZ_03415 [Brucellaceae bacterium C25G]